MIAIIDYGLGNLRSVEKAFLAVGAEAFVTADPGQVLAAEGVVLPGVGAFEVGMENLRKTGMDRAVLACVASGKPFLGICLGMQLLFEYSQETNAAIGTGAESGLAEGLGIVKGGVLKFEDSHQLKIPQMGWNSVRYREGSVLYRGIPQDAFFYFVHSYYCRPDNPEESAGLTEYGNVYTSVLERGNLFATQFHPEKSGEAGLRLLRNFAEFVRG